MSKKKRKSNTSKLANQSQPRISILQSSLLGCVILFLFTAPFQKGLFNGGQPAFDDPIYHGFIWAFLFLIILSIYLLLHWKFQVKSDLVQFFIWLLPLTYLISSIHAATHSQAMTSIYIHLMYAAFFLFGIYLTKAANGAERLQNSLLLSGYVLVIFGFMNWFGNASFWGLIHYSDGVHHIPVYYNAVMSDSNGPRLTSVFQYANSYAAYLIAIILASLFLMVLTKKKYLAAVAAVMLVPSIISFFLTLSRGGIVMLPIIIVLILPFLKPFRQILFFLHLLVAGILSLSTLSYISKTGLSLQSHVHSGKAFQAWLVLIVVSLVSAGLSHLIQHYAAPWLERSLTRFSSLRFSSFYIPIAGIVVAFIGIYIVFSHSGMKVLPANIRHRLETINFQTQSVYMRKTFYMDAFKIFKERPLFGGGGGAWSAMHEKIQSYPYLSNQAHNFFLQYLNEVGLVGLLLLLVFIAVIFYRFIRYSIASKEEDYSSSLILFVMAFSLLVHSAIDFDLSYVYLGIILFFILGALLSCVPSQPLSRKLLDSFNRWRWIFPSFLIVLSIFMLVVSGRHITAMSDYFQATHELNSGKANFQSVNQKLNDAMHLVKSPYYADQQLKILDQVYGQSHNTKFIDAANQVYHQFSRSEPYDLYLHTTETQFLIYQKKYKQALQLSEETLTKFPWNMSLYENTIVLYNQQALQNQSQDQGLAKQYWDKDLALYQEIQRRLGIVHQLPQNVKPDFSFQITPTIVDVIGQIQFHQAHFAQAEDTLKQSLHDSSDKALQQEVTRYYLASLQKQGKADSALYNQFIKQHPKEKQKIEQIVQEAK